MLLTKRFNMVVPESLACWLFKIYFWLFFCIEGNSHVLSPVIKTVAHNQCESYFCFMSCEYFACIMQPRITVLQEKCPAQIYLSCPEATTMVHFLF